MKCPKCEYLGFETGNRCRHCGHDFSLLATTGRAADDDRLTVPAAQPAASLDWADQIDRSLGASRELPLPLLQTPPAGADEPLIRLPASPRAPLAVRRTPDTRRVRPVSRQPDPYERGPLLELASRSPDAGVTPVRSSHAMPSVYEDGPTVTGRRLVAVGLDHALLFGIDAIVLYLTLRMVSMSMADWRLIVSPGLLAFLGMVKLAYFTVFTAACGQTIGKMATHIRVVGGDGLLVDPARAVWRTLAGTLSLVTLGLAFLPGLYGRDRRALHDRMTGTRVIRWPAV